MIEPIPLSRTVAVLGFSTFEHGAMSSLLRLAEARTPAYVEMVEADRADFLIANADHAGTVATVLERERLLDTVFVGAAPPGCAVACLHRPIEPGHIVQGLDALLEQRLTRIGGLVVRDPQPRDVIVVDDSRVARRFLQVRLQRRGYSVHTATTPEQALERIAAQPFAMVFLDVTLGHGASMDGLALCQRIKQSSTHPGGAAPQVVLVTSLSSPSDRVRGALAGCDAYLTKPVMEDDLTQTLLQLDPFAAA